MSRNHLNIEAVKKMFANGNWTRLEEVNLAFNRIKITNENSGFSALPKGIVSLNLKKNIIPRIRHSDLKGFKNLKRLDLGGCRLYEIEEGAFQSLTEIKWLGLYDNKLTKLPNDLFKFSTKLNNLHLYNNTLAALPNLRGIDHLNVLEMRRNQLTSVNVADLGVKYIRSLRFGSNKINSFNLNGTVFYSLDLSRNGITTLGDYAFSGQKKIRHLFLHDNKIDYISPRAFSGMTDLEELFLQRNELKSLHEGLFSGISMGRLYLFGNKLENTKGVLNGMRRAPNLILLFGNSNLTSFRSSDYQKMGKGSVIYIGCTTLKTIEGDNDLQANVICSPSNDLKLITPTSALQGDGFHCRRHSSNFLFLCTPCPVGTSEICNAEYCGGVCVPCPAGSFYQDEMASLHCKPCPPGQFVPPSRAPGKSPIDCLTCPKNTNTNNTAGYRACPCLPGYARTHRFGACTKCTMKGVTCKRDYSELVPGYWMTWEGIKTPWNASCKDFFQSFMRNLDIKNDTYDRSSVNFTSCNMPMPHKCPIKGSCKGGVEAACETGYSGVLCAVCSKGYMKQYNKCRKCPSRGVAIAQCIGYLLSFVIVCWLISATDKIKLADSDQFEEDGNQGNERTFADIILSSLKILLGFYQVVSGLIHALSYINWPHSLKSVMSSFEYIQFEVLRLPSLHCIKSEWRMDAIKEFWLAVIATFAVPLLIFLYFAVKSFFLYCCVAEFFQVQKRIKQCCKHSLRAAILFLFASYPLTCTRIVQILPISCHKFCTVMHNGNCLRKVSYMRRDYSLSCIQESDSALLQTAYAAMAIPLGLPIVLLLLLWRFSPRRNEQRAEPDRDSYIINEGEVAGDDYVNCRLIENGGTEQGTIQFALRFAFENYEPSCWYWEVVEMIRKLLMTVGVVFFLQNTKVGLSGIIIIATVFTMAQAAMNPIRDKFENFLQLLSLIIVPINLSIGAIIHSKGIHDEDIISKTEDAWALGVLLVILNSLLIVLIAFRFIRAIARKVVANIQESGNRSCMSRCLGFLCACVNLAPINRQLREMDTM